MDEQNQSNSKSEIVTKDNRKRKIELTIVIISITIVIMMTISLGVFIVNTFKDGMYREKMPNKNDVIIELSKRYDEQFVIIEELKNYDDFISGVTEKVYVVSPVDDNNIRFYTTIIQTGDNFNSSYKICDNYQTIVFKQQLNNLRKIYNNIDYEDSSYGIYGLEIYLKIDEYSNIEEAINAYYKITKDLLKSNAFKSKTINTYGASKISFTCKTKNEDNHELYSIPINEILDKNSSNINITNLQQEYNKIMHLDY